MINEINDKQLMNILKNISWLRMHFGISKKKMAELLKISVSSLNKIEDGILPPRLSMDMIFNVHKNFGIQPYVIFAFDFRKVNPFYGIKEEIKN